VNLIFWGLRLEFEPVLYHTAGSFQKKHAAGENRVAVSPCIGRQGDARVFPALIFSRKNSGK
jgi:hypothetical protein